jgi:hypothetical protein
VKRYLLFCLLLLNTISLFAEEMDWYEGSIVLKTKEVLVGEISIEPAYDLILHRIDGKVDVYPAHKIQSFHFYDKDANINRKFISLKQEGLFNSHQLYEVVLWGDVDIYRKQKAWTGNSPSDADGFSYYVSYRDQLNDIHKFRDRVYPYLLESAGSLLSVFMDENNLNPNFLANAITIAHFYNNLKREDQFLAKH